MEKSIYIDISDLIIDNTNTGIRRVERNIIKSIPSINKTITVNTIAVANMGQLIGLIPIDINTIKTQKSLLNYFYRIYLCALKPNHLKKFSITAFPFLSKWLETNWIKIRFIALPFLAIAFPILATSSLIYILIKHKPISLSPGDIYFIPGSTWWSRNLSSHIKSLQSSGVRFGFLLHDLIPITHPKYCQDKFSKVFKRYLPNILELSDIVICISHQTEMELKHLIPRETINKTAINYSGFELDLADNSQSTHSVRTKVILDSYIAIGTIEPRKNYSFLLDAFDLAWQNGINQTLCIIGKYGWKSEQLVERILTHPKYGKQLFWFNDLNDNELLYAYQHAKACVYPSIVEGFGLPLIEALSLKCPVLASDIPIFHEVGGDYCHYFSLETPQSLFELIVKVEKEGLLGNLDYLDTFQWPNWNESTAKLLDILTKTN